MWFEVAVIQSLFAVGNILFGHWEEGTPKWRRLAKLVVITGLAVGVSHFFGRAAFWGLLGIMTLGVLVIHAWWLPKHGVNGWTAEPKARYYELRGWKPRE